MSIIISKSDRYVKPGARCIRRLARQGGVLGVGLAAFLLLEMQLRARPQEGTVASPAAKAAEAPKPSNKKAKVAPHKLSGAELYSMHCNRCHPERYPTERTAAQWRTILLHMRVRANLPAGQARTILQYLQDNSGR